MGRSHAWIRRRPGGGRPLTRTATRQATDPPSILSTEVRPASIARGIAAVRPRPAASLVLFDRTGADVRFLMGRRASGHAFMPGHLVFPGGRLDAGDLLLARRFLLSDDAAQRLTASTQARFTARHAAALALAAIRETFEETGAMVGEPAAFASDAAFWRDFASAGLRPLPAALTPVARALTPSWFPRRYDTRFFLAHRSAIARSLPFEVRPTDEFDEVAWVTAREAAGFTLAPITQAILAHAAGRIADGSAADASRPIPFYRNMGGTFRIEAL